MSATIEFRQARASDLAYVASTFAESAPQASAYFKGTTAKWRRDTMFALATADGWRVIVACHHGDEDLVVGWVALGPKDGEVAWVYVRRALRGVGVGRSLLMFALGKRKEDSRTIETPFAVTDAGVRAWLENSGVVKVRFRPWAALASLGRV